MDQKEEGAAASRRERGRHFGAYIVDDDLLEMIALLRVRLRVDNAGLLKLAVERLYQEEEGKRRAR